MNIQDVQAKIGAVDGLYKLFFEGDPSSVRDVLADDYEQLPPQAPDTKPGVDNFLEAFMQGMGSMFSDVEGEATHVVVDGDYVVVRGEYSATHTGEAFGIPATGARFTFTAFDLHHIQDGRIAETWHLEDFRASTPSSRQASPNRRPVGSTQ